MGNDWIDAAGFRANVGIILANADNELMLGGRVGAKGWQFPQGGMLQGEHPEDAMFRELHEEVGLEQGDVEVLGVTNDWLRYRLPDKFIRRSRKPLCIGQKQRWYLLKLVSDPSRVRFDTTNEPEFNRCRWVDYWRPVKEVIYFKRHVYVQALTELGPLAFPDVGPPPQPTWWPRRWQESRT